MISQEPGSIDRPSRHSPGWRVLAGILWALILVLIACSGFWLGLRIAGPSTHASPFGQIEVRLDLATKGQVDVFVPIVDWGVRAPLYDAPFKLTVEPRVIERQALVEAAGADQEVLLRAEAEFKEAAQSATERAFLWALAGVALISGLALLILKAAGWARRGRLLVLAFVPLALALCFVCASLVAASGSFDAGRFSDARYYARGGELRRLISIVERTRSLRAGYHNQLQRTIAGYAALLSGLERLPGAGVRGTFEQGGSLLVLSDLHGNTQSLDAITRISGDQGEDKSPVVISGDFGNSGDRNEAAEIAAAIEDLPGQVIAVSGNHDSELMMRAIAGAGGIVLGRRGRLQEDGRWDGIEVQMINGRRWAAYDDPLEYRGQNPDQPGRTFSFSERPDGLAAQAFADQELITWFEALPQQPEILLIHNVASAEHLAEHLQLETETEAGGAEAGRTSAKPPTTSSAKPLLILAGHDHRQHIERYGNVLIVDSGTAGAGGLLGTGTTPVSFSELSFGQGVLPRSADMIEIEPISGQAQAQRVVPGAEDACDGHYIVCHGQ